MTQTIEQLTARVTELEATESTLYEQLGEANSRNTALNRRITHLETAAATAVQQYKDEVMKLAGEPVAVATGDVTNTGYIHVRFDCRKKLGRGELFFTADQVTAATARLEAELTQCKDEKAMCLRVSAELRQQLAAVQLDNQRLRGLLSNAIQFHDSYYQYAEEIKQTLSTPADISALDAYVAEKAKEAQEAADFNFEQYQDLGVELDKVCRQRDLAVEALEKQGHSAGCRKNAFGDMCTCGLDDLLSTIKESEAK